MPHLLILIDAQDGEDALSITEITWKEIDFLQPFIDKLKSLDGGWEPELADMPQWDFLEPRMPKPKSVFYKILEISVIPEPPISLYTSN